MDLQSIFSLFFFVLFLLAITVIGYPFTALIFKENEDHGFAFSKLFVILALAFFSWLIGFFGPFYKPILISLVFLAISCLSAFLYYSQKHQLRKVFDSNKKLFITEEAIFWIFFILFLIIRIGNPDLWHPIMGGEKPMDFAFLNAMVRTDSLPPFDPWFAGGTINYYYFGQFIAATLVKLSGIPSTIFYNLFLCFLFAQTAVGSFSIVYSFVKSKIFSLLGSFFVLICGNLAQIPVIASSFKNHVPINGWYWTATRVMPNSEINEFPFFTFLYADLHSHLIALPIDLFLIYFLIETYKTASSGESRRVIFLSFPIAFLLGIIRMTNIWDYPTFLLLSITVVVPILFFRAGKILKRIFQSVLFIGNIIFFSNIFILPFIIYYKTPPLGLELYNGPQTKISDYLLIHGFFFVILGLFLVLFSKIENFGKLTKIERLLNYFPLAVSAILFAFDLRFLSFLSLLVSLLIFVFYTSKNKHFLMPAFLFIFAIFLTAIPDIIGIKLGLGRMNTVFKFYFQAWIFFAIGSAIVSYYIFEGVKKDKLIKIPIIAIFLTFFAVTISYPITAAPAKILDRMGKDRTPTLNGERYMVDSIYYDQNQILTLSYDLSAINWIRNNIKDAPVILEASTPIYRWGSRVSIYTGLPTVLGWDWHEIAHRQYLPPDDVKIRSTHIKQMYEGSDFTREKELLLLYNISYIYLGQLERAYYNTSGIKNLIFENPSYFEKVYENPQVAIYKFLNGRNY